MVQLLIIILILLAVSMISAYATASTYMWIIYALAALMCVVFGMAVYGIYKAKKVSLSKPCRFYNGVAVVMLLITFANMLYWNLFMWWYI